MARLPRLSVGGWPHLLIQRGHNRQAVFRDSDDRRLFLTLLGEAARAQGIALHAYALLDGELRLLATPPTGTALSSMMQSLGRRYGAYFNRRHDCTGSLWDGRFRATVIDPECHLLSCMRFVETVSTAEQLRGETHPEWSSAKHHLGQQLDPIVSDHSSYWALGNTPFERELAYRNLLERPLPDAERAMLEQAATKGWPVGSAGFLGALGSKTERRLTPLRRGRPRKPVTAV